MLVGAEQAREVVTLVTSEAPCSLQWVERYVVPLVGHCRQNGTERIFPFDEISMFLFHVVPNAFSVT